MMRNVSQVAMLLCWVMADYLTASWNPHLKGKGFPVVLHSHIDCIFLHTLHLVEPSSPERDSYSTLETFY